MLKNNWLVCKDIDRLSEQLAYDILEISKKSIRLKNSFSIVLTGGRSVIKLYKILGSSTSDWSKWHIYLTDERCLPVGDKDRNDNMINKIWLNNHQILEKNIHFIHAELGVSDGVIHYEKILNGMGDFDVVLLSMGEDGHTASLFPSSIYSNKDVVVENNSLKYPKKRISMSYSRLNRSKNILKIVCGGLKQGAVDLWLNGGVLPINKINGKNEKVYICKNTLTKD